MLWTLALLGAATTVVNVPVDSFADVAAWSLHKDGGAGASCRVEDGALRIAYDASGANKWGNLTRAITAPADWLAVTFRLRIVSAQPGSAMYLWLMEADGDAHMTEIQPGGKKVSDAPRGVWHTVRIPVATLAYQPRGDKKPDIGSVNRMLLGCNYDAVEVLVDDLVFETGPPPKLVPLPRSATWQPVDGPRGRLALLDEPGLARTAGGFDADRLAPRLTAAGFGVTRVRSGDLADATRLNRATFDLLLLNAPDFPLAAREGLLGYLKAGGAFLSLGGYAFDRPLAHTDNGWEEVPAEAAANRINARYGKPGDTMALEPNQIGLFDPTATLNRVAGAELGGRKLAAALEGYAGVSMAGLNSPVFPDQHGETQALGQTYDALGRPRGALGVIAQFHDGPFRGAGWGGFGVSNRDLFADDAFGLDPLLFACDRLVSGLYPRTPEISPVCARPGETVKLTVAVGNRGRAARAAQLALRVDGKVVSTPALSVAAGATGTVTVEQTAAGAYHRVEAALLLDGKEQAVGESAYTVWDEAQVRAGRDIAWRDNAFWTAGRPAFLTGTNQTGVMWHSPRENPLTWDRDFAAMADHGLSVWRVLHFSPFGAMVDGKRTDNPLLLANDPPEKLVRQTDAIVQLAQKHGVVLFPCAHDWMQVGLSDEELAAQRKWCRFWSSRYKSVPGLIWDIQNEPSVTVQAESPVHRQLFESYLTERHGDLAKARAWLGVAADAPLIPAAGDGAWGDLKAVATEEFRVWLVQRWVRENVAGLKEGNPNVAVTVGYLQSRHPADKIEGQKGLDFANMHSYDASRAFYTSFRFIDRRAYGQGLTLGEFGARTLHELRVRGGDGEAGDADSRLFNTTTGLAFGAGGAMALNWCFRGLPDVVFPWELFRSDRVGRPPLADFAAMTLATRGVQPTYQPPAVYLLIPDSNRVGPRYGDIDNALARSIETLHGLHVPFALLHERDLRIPAQAKAIYWPVPYCPGDAAFAKVEAWVKAGGHLYLSGDVGFDEQRRYTRGERLARLGLPATAGRDPFGASDANAAAVTSKAGAGSVTFVPSPLEISAAARLPEFYAAFAKAAGVARWAVSPDIADVQVGQMPSRDGSVAWVAASWGQDRDVTVGGVTMRVQRDNLGLVHLGADGAVRTVLAQGDVGGVATADGPFVALSGTAGDLRTSSSLVVAPLGVRSLALTTRHAWQAPVASVGEVREGRWHELAKVPVRIGGGQVKLTLGEDYRNTYVVIAEPAGLAAAANALVAAVLMR